MSLRVFSLCIFFAVITVFSYTYTVYSGLSSAAFSNKKTELQQAASDFSASFSAYGSIPDHSLFPWSGVKKRVIITDEELKVIYDSSDIEKTTSKILFVPSTLSALKGDAFFESSIISGSIESIFAIPFVEEGNIRGTLLILESDPSLKQTLNSLFLSLLISSGITILFFLLLFAYVSHLLKARLSQLLSSIKKSRENSGTEKIPVLSHDETTPIVEEFNKIYEELDYVQQMRQAFVSDASHELRTPLSAIKLLCESITGTENVSPETTKEFLDDIVLEVDRMSHTAEKLLVLSRLDNNSVSTLSPVPISEIIYKSISNLAPFADDKNISINSYVEEDCIILGEIEGTSQIVSNIIDNAIKYNNPGGNINVFLFSKNRKCHFIVDDSGIGIAPEFREQVFERFYRVDKSRKHDGRGGSGLGLAIVKRNVESFGGTIAISESPCGGSRFTVIFQSLSEEEAYI